MPAVLLSLLTILVWSTGTLFSAGVSHLPPFLATGVTLCIGGVVGLARVRPPRPSGNASGAPPPYAGLAATGWAPV